MNSGASVPELLVQPEGLEPIDAPAPSNIVHEDPLLELFRTKSSLPTEEFQEELRKQRGSQAQQAESASA